MNKLRLSSIMGFLLSTMSHGGPIPQVFGALAKHRKVARDIYRKYPSRSKYHPHQGEQEIARRRRQAEKLALKRVGT